MLVKHTTIVIKTIIFLLLILVPMGMGEVFDECDGVEDGSFVASWEDCAAYIYCDGEDSILGDCGEGLYFDPDELSCDDKDNVFCPLDVVTEVPEEPETTTTTTTTSTTSSPATTTTPSSTTTSTTESVPTTSTFDPLTVPPIIRDHCPQTDDPNQIVLIPNSQSCVDYYLCYHGHAIEMHCTNHLHFNTYTGKCDFPENVQCLNDRPNANKCLPHITDFFPHPEKCNYFYYCIKGFLTLQQCPFYYGYDIERRSCVHISQAKCFNSEKKIIS